ncbi:MAG: DUF4136 domain-containing protein [Rhodoferax sp.]
MFRSLIATFLIALGLTGCGTTRLVDSDVRSYATPPAVPVGAHYRFERLPSQQANAAQQARLEAMAQQALAKVGLQRDDAGASYSVQVSVGVKVDPYSPGDGPYDGWWPGWNLGFGLHSGHMMIGGSRLMHGFPGFGVPDRPYYWRRVSLIIRSASTLQVVYETQAAHDGPWSDSDTILSAMFDAALKDFPAPTQGVRRVNIEIPR